MPIAFLDLYSVLEVVPNASNPIIEAAYKTLLNTNPSKKLLEEIEQAYFVLSDATRRKRYDESVYSLDRQKIVGSFRVLSLLAEGGYAKVFLGEHILSGKKVCIKHCKKLSPEYQRILIEEWNTVCDLAHYEIPVMRDLVRLEDGTLALVMSYIPGKTLEQWVQELGRLDAEDVAWIAERALNACRYLHTHGVIHGDIKPQNIIIREENHTVVLIDYGLALAKPIATTRSKGYTDVYAPPEQEKGMTLVPESDFYSLGMTMIFALSGKIAGVERREVPTDTPLPLRNFIRRLIKREVADRPRWEEKDRNIGENLCASIQKVRMESFGRIESRMKLIGKPYPK